jgi:hypothetical protein
MLDSAIRLHAELDVVAICPSDETYPFDLLDRKGGDGLFLVTDQLEPPNAAAIGEADVLAVLGEFPARRFVLDRSVVVLKLGIALFPRLVGLAVVIEAGNGQPGAIGAGLPRLGVETSRKGVFLSQDRTVALQVILRDAMLIHPLAQALIPDELDDTNGLLNGHVLLVGSLAFVLVGQHVWIPPCL